MKAINQRPRATKCLWTLHRQKWRYSFEILISDACYLYVAVWHMLSPSLSAGRSPVTEDNIWYCWCRVLTDMGTTQSLIMTRLRIKCFRLRHESIWINAWGSVESWVDSKSIPLKVPWVMSRSETILGDPLESWVNSESIPWKAAWIMTWIDSTFWYAAWVMSWFSQFFGKTFESKVQKSATIAILDLAALEMTVLSGIDDEPIRLRAVPV